MIAAVAPFALERRLIPFAATGDSQRVNIRSLVTGASISSDVQLVRDEDDNAHVRYLGDTVVAGVPGAASPVVIRTEGIAGIESGKLLPTGRVVDYIDAGVPGLESVACTVVDFARMLVVVEGAQVLAAFGYQSLASITKARADDDADLSAALERLRLEAGVLAGLDDCAGRDAPKVCLVARAPSARGMPGLHCCYWVKPGRREMHAAMAMTAAQALAAACILPESVAAACLGLPTVPEPCAAPRAFSLDITHVSGVFPVTVNVSAEGLPYSGQYITTCMPIAKGEVVVGPA
jgi:2-methylaconitate cis-trans-isomerase PrpF